MLHHITVIFYNFAVFCGICNLSLAGLLLYKQKTKKVERLFLFLMLFFIYGFLNMILYYKLHILEALSIMPYYAMFISVAYGMMNWQWIYYLMGTSEQEKRAVKRYLLPAGVCCILLWTIDSLLFMDEHFNIVHQAGNGISTFAECGALLGMAIFCMKKWKKAEMTHYEKSAGALLLGYFFCITIQDIRISFFEYDVEAFSASSWSLGSIFCFLMNILTVLSLTGQFKALMEEAWQNKMELQTDHLTLEELREKYRISQREMDVLVLIYKGKNNAQIAADLFISENTVKKHINSIFKKLEVKSKAEVMSKIRLKNL